MERTVIEFEGCGHYLTAKRGGGEVLIRCNSSYTDIRDDEPLEGFVLRHGGSAATAEYLKAAYREAR